MHDAPRATLASNPGRVEKLKATAAWQCTCEGVSTGHATFVLQSNGEDIKTFCGGVPQSLTLGARR